MFFFFFISTKVGFNISCKISSLEATCMKLHTLLSGKIFQNACWNFYPVCKVLTLKVLSKLVAEDILNFYLLFFRENKTWHFLSIISYADDSHEMTNLNVSEKKKKCRLLQLWLVLYGLRCGGSESSTCTDQNIGFPMFWLVFYSANSWLSILEWL